VTTDIGGGPDAGFHKAAGDGADAYVSTSAVASQSLMCAGNPVHRSSSGLDTPLGQLAVVVRLGVPREVEVAN
jgi:hypothetical protein